MITLFALMYAIGNTIISICSFVGFKADLKKCQNYYDLEKCKNFALTHASAVQLLILTALLGLGSYVLDDLPILGDSSTWLFYVSCVCLATVYLVRLFSFLANVKYFSLHRYLMKDVKELKKICKDIRMLDEKLLFFDENGFYEKHPELKGFFVNDGTRHKIFN